MVASHLRCLEYRKAFQIKMAILKQSSVSLSGGSIKEEEAEALSYLFSSFVVESRDCSEDVLKKQFER